MKKIGSLVAVLGFIFLSGCATLSKEECLNANWSEIGKEDGAKGYKTSRIEKHGKACSKHGIMPDRKVYSKGRNLGLKIYCTPANGMEEGMNGHYYHHVCPKKLEKYFLKKYKVGYKIHTLESKISDYKDDLKKKTKELGEKKGLTVDQKVELKVEIEKIRMKIEENNKKLYYIKGKAGVAL